MLEAVLGQVASFLWFAISQFAGYYTGKALVQELTFGRLAVGDYGKRPFSVWWRAGRQAMLNPDIAVVIGWIFWLGLTISTIFLVGHLQSSAQ